MSDAPISASSKGTSDEALAKAIDSLPATAGPTDPAIRRLTWDEFCGRRSVFRNLLDIRGFSLLLDVSPVPELADREVASRLATAMYGIVLKAIEEARFYQEDTLTLRSEPGAAGIIYGDDRFDFAVQVTHSPEANRQGQLALTRTGSRLEDFHSWYVSLAPQFEDIVNGAMQQCRMISGRSIEAFRGAYQFRFLLHDFRAGASQTKVRNSDLMKKLVRGVPDDDGQLSEDPSVIEAAGRIDVSLSRWVSIGDDRALERYNIEAPANKEGAGLWLQFSHGGETYSLGAVREKFDLSRFLRQSGIAYTQFLRDKALDKFLANLLGDTSFRSATTSLP